MRIVITKNGRIIISEINPEIRYKSISTFHNPLQNKKIGNKSRNNSYKNNSRILTIGSQNSDIDDVLSDIKSLKNNFQSNTKYKFLNINPNKHLVMPQSISEKYFSMQNMTETEDKNILSDVFISINKSIENDANKKGFNYVYNNISSLKTMNEKEIENSFKRRSSILDTSTKGRMDNERYSTTFNLPRILPSYPLKYIINSKSISNIKKEMRIKEYELKKGSLLTENNFRSKVMANPRLTMEESLKNEIKAENKNLITYLNKSKDIKAPFVERLGLYDDERIKRLNKISQQTLILNVQEKEIRKKIRDKIRGIYRQSSEEYKRGLETMKEKLNKYENIVKNEEKKMVDKRERYLNQYNEAEKDWIKSNALRFYHKNKPPQNSATSLILEK